MKISVFDYGWRTDWTGREQMTMALTKTVALGYGGVGI